MGLVLQLRSPGRVASTRSFCIVARGAIAESRRQRLQRSAPQAQQRRASATPLHAKSNASNSWDLIVVGYGLAGTSAAIAAAENGAKVLVLERDAGGGTSAMSGGVVYAGGGTPYQKAVGLDDTPENMFQYLRLEVGDAVSEKTVRKFCNESAERLAWLEKYGAKFDASLCDYKTTYPTDKHYLYYSGNEKAYPFREHAKPVARGHRMHEKGLDSGRAMMKNLHKSAKSLAVTVIHAAQVEKLDMEDGKVTGIQYRTIQPSLWRQVYLYLVGMKSRSDPIGTHSNKTFSRRAADAIFNSRSITATAKSKRVVISAGGFNFNQEWGTKHLSAYNRVAPMGCGRDIGEGIRLGESFGGSTSHMSKMTAWRFIAPPSAFTEGIVVAGNGERVAPEDLYGATFADRLIESGGKGYLILDSTQVAKVKSQLSTQTDYPMRLVPLWSLWYGHLKANDIATLATKIGVPVDQVKGTIEAYNKGIASSAGDPARKAAAYCSPILNPPFYAIDVSIRPTGFPPVIGMTLGGLRVDENSGLVMNTENKTIPGLYAAGRSAVGICSNSYISGLSLADCVFSGKRAGEHAAANMLTRTDKSLPG